MAQPSQPGAQTRATAGGMRWTSLNAQAFHVRTGPNYRKNKKKAPSADSLYDVEEIFLFHADQPVASAAEVLHPMWNRHRHTSGEAIPVPEVLYVCWNLPMEAPKLFGKAKASDTSVLVFRFGLAPWARDAYLTSTSAAPPSLAVWREYCSQAPGDTAFRSRFKAIAAVENASEAAIPSFVRGYNGKPVLIKKSGTLSQTGEYLEMSINVNQWGFNTRRAFDSLHGTGGFAKMIINVGFVIEAREELELPEQILACARVFNPTDECMEAWPPTPPAAGEEALVGAPAAEDVAGDGEATARGDADFEEREEVPGAAFGDQAEEVPPVSRDRPQQQHGEGPNANAEDAKRLLRDPGPGPNSTLRTSNDQQHSKRQAKQRIL